MTPHQSVVLSVVNYCPSIHGCCPGWLYGLSCCVRFHFHQGFPLNFSTFCFLRSHGGNQSFENSFHLQMCSLVTGLLWVTKGRFQKQAMRVRVMGLCMSFFLNIGSNKQGRDMTGRIFIMQQDTDIFLLRFW